MTNILDKISHKNSKSLKILVYLHKIFMVDVQSAQSVIERDDEFKNQISFIMLRFALKLSNLTGIEFLKTEKNGNNLTTILKYLGVEKESKNNNEI